MPELLDELSIARSGGELKKCMASYKKVDLLILDEWLMPEGLSIPLASAASWKWI